MTVIRKMTHRADVSDRVRAANIESRLADAEAAISQLGLAAEGASAQDLDELARAAARIDEVLARAVRMIHAAGGDD